MTRWIELMLSHMYPWPIGVLFGAAAASLLFGLIGVWLLWRVRRLLAVVPLVQDRLDALSNSLSLLTDTTESCFKALSMQLQFMLAQHGQPVVPVSARQHGQSAGLPDDLETLGTRQRRVVEAARRGEGIGAIAAREDVAESEIALRLHLNRDARTPEPKRYGSVLS